MFVFPVNEIKDLNYFSRDLSVKVMVGFFVFFQGLSGSMLQMALGDLDLIAIDGFSGFKWLKCRWP